MAGVSGRDHKGVLLRRYESRDGPAVRGLFIQINRAMATEALREPFERYIERSLREEIGRIEMYYAERQGSFWVAEEAGAVVGTFGLERADDSSAELRRMYVAPGARRRGIARMMLERAEQLSLEAGYAHLILSTSELQQAALQLYRGAGYTLVREEVSTAESNKTVGSGLKRLHLEKRLAPGP